MRIKSFAVYHDSVVVNDGRIAACGDEWPGTRFLVVNFLATALKRADAFEKHGEDVTVGVPGHLGSALANVSVRRIHAPVGYIYRRRTTCLDLDIRRLFLTAFTATGRQRQQREQN